MSKSWRTPPASGSSRTPDPRRPSPLACRLSSSPRPPQYQVFGSLIARAIITVDVVLASSASCTISLLWSVQVALGQRGTEEALNTYRLQQFQSRRLHAAFLKIGARLLDDCLDDLLVDLALLPSSQSIMRVAMEGCAGRDLANIVRRLPR